MQACRRGGMELWSSEGALQACRRGGMDVWRSGDAMAASVQTSRYDSLEACYRRGDGEVWRS